MSANHAKKVPSQEFMSRLSHVEQEIASLLCEQDTWNNSPNYASESFLSVPAAHPLSYLSTPLRLKHFPKISPETLRLFLSSPSIRASTPDQSGTSFDLSQVIPNLAISSGTPEKQYIPPFQSSMLLDWIASTKDSTIDSCVRHFEAYFRDPAQKTLIIASLKRLAHLKNGILVAQTCPSDLNQAGDTSAIPLASPILLLKPDPNRLAKRNQDDSFDSFYLSEECDDSILDISVDSQDHVSPNQPIRSSAYTRPRTTTLMSPTAIGKYQTVMNQLMGVVNSPTDPFSSSSFAPILSEPGGQSYLPSPPLEDGAPFISTPAVVIDHGGDLNHELFGSSPPQFPVSPENDEEDMVPQARHLLELSARLEHLAMETKRLALRMTEECTNGEMNRIIGVNLCEHG